MDLDAFTSRLGDGQGRIAFPDGDAVFVLGDINAGRFFELAPGDHVEVVQSLDLAGVAFIRATLSLRVPTSLSAGLAWEASIVLDGEKRATFRCGAGRTRPTSDLAANVSKLAGVHEVGVRLELVASE